MFLLVSNHGLIKIDLLLIRLKRRLFYLRIKIKSDVNILFGGIKIKIQDKIKHLGVILDKKLSWTVHILDRASTAKRYSAKLLCAAKTTWV